MGLLPFKLLFFSSLFLKFGFRLASPLPEPVRLRIPMSSLPIPISSSTSVVFGDAVCMDSVSSLLLSASSSSIINVNGSNSSSSTVSRRDSIILHTASEWRNTKDERNLGNTIETSAKVPIIFVKIDSSGQPMIELEKDILMENRGEGGRRGEEVDGSGGAIFRAIEDFFFGNGTQP